MSRTRQRQLGKGMLDLLEEAVHLLRGAPARLLAAYYLGALPFALGLLYFWADMSRGAFAYQHGGETALGVALLYLWMKSWQAVFAQGLLERLCGGRPVPLDRRRLGRLVTIQTLVQPTALFALPVAALMIVPLGMTYAFYHNLSACGDGRAARARPAVRQAWRQASQWPGQNYALIAGLWLLGLFVFANIVSGLLLVPVLLKTLLGLESKFTLSPWAALNTTFFAAALALTYLCVNPLIKTVYVLRCFYGQSLATGEDLKAELRALRPALGVVLAVMLWSAGAAGAAAATAADAGLESQAKATTERRPPEPVAPDPAIEQQLDRSIEEVIGRPEYTWRLPREKAPPAVKQQGWIGRFIDMVADTAAKRWHAFKRFGQHVAERLIEWLRDNSRPERPRGSGPGVLRGLLVVLMVVVAGLLVLFAWRVWKRRSPRVVATAEPVRPPPDLADDNVTADELPADGWLALAGEALAAGDVRRALRALYLAGLAHLGGCELLTIAKFKSNHEYEIELQRRARDRGELLAAFSQNISRFEFAWYGMHEVTAEDYERVRANFDRIRQEATP